MPDNTAPGLGDLLGLFGGTNPLGGLTRSVSQFQRGVNELLSTIENLNRSLEQFNQMSARVNGLLDLVEEPIKAFLPQVTRTVRAADELVERLSAPVDKVAPGLTRLAETLSNPALTTLPKDLNEFLAVLRDLARRLQPLGQMAETAGGLFTRGPFAAFLGGTTNRPEPPAPTPAAISDPIPVTPDEVIPPRRLTTAKRASTTRSTSRSTTGSSTRAASSTAAKKAAPRRRPPAR